MNLDVALPQIGFASFGAVVGWMTHYVVAKTEKVGVKWLGSMIVVISGGAVAALAHREGLPFFPFPPYATGLAIAFFSRLLFTALGDLMRRDPAVDGPPREHGGKVEGRRLFEYEGYYPVDVAPGTHLPSLNSERYVLAIRHLLDDRFDRLAAMDLVYLREDNRQHVGDVLPPDASTLYETFLHKYELFEFQATYSHEARRLFMNVEKIVNDLGDTLQGVYFEAVLHDVRNPLRSIVAVRNAREVSGRRLHDPSTRFVVQYVRHQGRHLLQAMDTGTLVAYPKQFLKTRNLKATTTPLYDERYGLVGILCFNIDVDAVNALDDEGQRRFLANYTRTNGETPEFELETAPER